MPRHNIKLNNHLYILGSLFVTTLGFGIILFSILASKSYCKNQEPTECINMGVFSIPNNSLPNLIGSFTGAFFTFYTFYLLEETKRRAQPKPKIEVSFEPDTTTTEDKFRELVVECEPHYIYLEDKKKNLSIGNACYLRVKVTNRGNIVARNCRAYLKKIEERGESGKWKALKGYEDSMPLLWAYERKEDYFVVSSGKDLASLASDYVDVLVSYESFIALRCLDDGQKDLTKWFLKLKTKRQVPKHAKLLEIDQNVQSEFKLIVEVYADECLTSQVGIILYHEKKQKNKDEEGNFLSVYNEKDGNEEENKARMKLYSCMTTLPIGYDVSEIYESL